MYAALYITIVMYAALYISKARNSFSGNVRVY